MMDDDQSLHVVLMTLQSHGIVVVVGHAVGIDQYWMSIDEDAIEGMVVKVIFSSWIVGVVGSIDDLIDMEWMQSYLIPVTVRTWNQHERSYHGIDQMVGSVG